MRKYMSKRQRPCDFCRSRKSACRIEGEPPCRLCLLHGRVCTFVEAAKPRKKQSAADIGQQSIWDASHTGSPAYSVMATEGTPASTGGARDELESVQPAMPSYAAQMQSQVLQPPFPTDHMTDLSDPGLDFLYDLAIDGSEYQFMFRTPHSPAGSRVSTPREPMPATTGPAMSPGDLDGAGSAYPEVLGLSSDMDPFLLQQYRTDSDGIFKFKQLAVHSVQQQPFPLQFLVSPPSIFTRNREEVGYQPVDEDALRANLEQVVTPEQGRRLLILYDQYIATQYPVFSAQSPPDVAGSPPHLLAAIYAITIPFATHDEKLCIDLAYNAPPYAALSSIINKAMTVELHSPSLAGVQALLLVVSRPSSNPLVSDASYRWSTLAALVASATNLGLHLDPSSWNIAPWQVAQRRRISYLIYAADRWLAAALGRPPHIDERNWLVASLQSSDSLDSGLGTDQWSQLLDLSALTVVLDGTLFKLYSIRAVQDLAQDDQRTADIANTLLNDLDTAIRSIRARHDRPSSSDPLMMRSILQLSHHYIQLTILRATMRPHVLPRSSQGVPALQLGTEDSGKALRSVMEQCIRDFSLFIKTLKTEHVIGLWPPWCPTAFSSLGFTLLLMLNSAVSYEEATTWLQQLQSVRKDMRLKSASFPVLRLGLLRIDSIFWRGLENVLHLQPHVADAVRDLHRG